MLGSTQSLNSTSLTSRPSFFACAIANSVASFATLGMTPMRKGLSCAMAVADAATPRVATAAPRASLKSRCLRSIKSIQES
ncbi:hypothetical protein D3C72_2140810 [compost metagenome]